MLFFDFISLDFLNFWCDIDLYVIACLHVSEMSVYILGNNSLVAKLEVFLKILNFGMLKEANYVFLSFFREYRNVLI